jgi:hypothetical protein
MINNILYIGGSGLVGSKIIEIAKQKLPPHNTFIGGRSNTANLLNFIKLNVNDPNSLKAIINFNINLIVLCTNDNYNNVLNFCIEHQISYLDITKPTSEVEKAYKIALSKPIKSKIVFGSGWMGGLVGGLLNSKKNAKQNITEVKLFIYYDIDDLAGPSSAFFIAENVSKPFKIYRKNDSHQALNFMEAESHNFSFGIGKRRCYNFDTPDLFILNRIENIPTVQVKATYSSKFVTDLLHRLQVFKVFKVLPLRLRKLIFSANGKGAPTVFEILSKNEKSTDILSVKSSLGQAYLTAFTTVLNIEKILISDYNGVFFSHQLFETGELISLLKNGGFVFDYKKSF